MGEGQVTSLKRFKDDAREVIQGQECGSDGQPRRPGRGRPGALHDRGDRSDALARGGEHVVQVALGLVELHLGEVDSLKGKLTRSAA